MQPAEIDLAAKNAETAENFGKTDATTDHDTSTAGPECNRFLSCLCVLWVLWVLCGSNHGGQIKAFMKDIKTLSD